MSDHILSINIKARDKATLDNIIVTVESIEGDGSELAALEIYTMETALDETNDMLCQQVYRQFARDSWLSPFCEVQEAGLQGMAGNNP